VLQLLLTANVVPSLLILSTLMTKAMLRSSATWVLGVLQEPHGVTSHKTAFFIVAAVNASDLTHSKTFITA
jgi:hypothetical protein